MSEQFCTVNGATVPVGGLVDALVHIAAENLLALAVERAHSAHLSAVLMAQVVDPASGDSEGSESPIGPNQGTPEATVGAEGGRPSTSGDHE